MTFTEEARKTVASIWQKSKEHPFILALKAGTLPPETFRFYLIQDQYYLEHFRKIYVKAAEIAQNPELEAYFLEGIERLETAEIAVRNSFFKELQITDKEIAATPVAPTTYHYSSHLYRQVQTKSLARVAAALLPCYWLYQEIGEELIISGSPVPLYQRWIETYKSESYQKSVIHHKKLTNFLAEQASEQEQKLMKQAFFISSCEELNFWEMAYTKQQWEGKND